MYMIYIFIDPAPDGNLNNKNPRCLHVLGFAKTTNTQRSFLMEGGSYIFKPHKVNQNFVTIIYFFYIIKLSSNIFI